MGNGVVDVCSTTPCLIHEHVLDGMLPKHSEAADPIAKSASQYTQREPKRLRGQIFAVLDHAPVDHLYLPGIQRF